MSFFLKIVTLMRIRMKKFTSIGDLLKNYRNREDISQSDLASEFDVDIRSIIRWEKNETLLNNIKEEEMAAITFIPYQVIRNLNTTSPIPIFYDFDIRKYSLSSLSTELPDADWIRSRIDVDTSRLRNINTAEDIENILRFTNLQNNPLKNTNKKLIFDTAKKFPELNLIILDQSGHYSGHCVYFSISLNTYQQIKNKTLIETELDTHHLVDYRTQETPVFYCHSITADCNENFFFMIGEVLKFYRDTPLKDYIYALLTSRYDSHHMSEQLGIKTVWEDEGLKKEHHLLSAPRLVEGNFKAFLGKN
jgi:transcriptional regulator with XRE-family HTH domain